jgi:hypothetical protein
VLYVFWNIKLTVCVFCACVCLGACEIDKAGLIFMEFYKDFPKAIPEITAKHFTYKLMGENFV